MRPTTAPLHLSHKPVITINNYAKKDGIYANKTDAVALSLGKAQWDHDDFSAKVWRHTGQQWSRQSEELPMHRALDLSILIIGSMVQQKMGHLPDHLFNIQNENAGALGELHAYFEQHKEVLEERIQELNRITGAYLKNK